MNWNLLKTIIPWAITVIVGFPSVYYLITAPSVELSGVVEFDAIVLPGDPQGDLRTLAESFGRDSLRSHFDRPKYFPDSADGHSLDYDKFDLFWDLYEYSSNKIANAFPVPYSSIRGYWALSLKNGESLEVESVEIYLPDAILVRVQREGIRSELQRIDHLLNLGRMRPGEVVNIIAWTDSSPTEYDAENIRITHKGGVGELEIRQRVGSFAQFFDNGAFVFLIIFFLAIAIFISLFSTYAYGWNQRVRSERSRNSDDSTSE